MLKHRNSLQKSLFALSSYALTYVALKIGRAKGRCGGGARSWRGQARTAHRWERRLLQLLIVLALSLSLLLLLLLLLSLLLVII